jgi:hypothetical protein
MHTPKGPLLDRHLAVAPPEKTLFLQRITPSITPGLRKQYKARNQHRYS